MNPVFISYKKAIIVKRKDGVDIIDPVTNAWKPAKSIQAAKWNLTVWERLYETFMQNDKPLFM
jgi:hypothetical protein